MNILVACEESQAVTIELRALGHNAFSCDIMDCSGGHPEWHIKQDVLPLLDGNCEFYCSDSKENKHFIDGKWDMIIAFPPCTHLAVSGAAWFEKKREDGRQREAIEFFCRLLNANCEKIAVENPVNIISGRYTHKWFPDLAKKYNLPIKPTQFIQPYEFGERVRKKTGLWLKNLKPLIPTNIVEPEVITVTYKNKTTSYSGAMWYAKDETGKILAFNDPMTGIIRSKTYKGVAKAMAKQWAGENKHNP